MRMIYHSDLGLDPVEVEVEEIDFERGSAKITVPVGPDALANVFRQHGEPLVTSVKRTVPRSSLRRP